MIGPSLFKRPGSKQPALCGSRPVGLHGQWQNDGAMGDELQCTKCKERLLRIKGQGEEQEEVTIDPEKLAALSPRAHKILDVLMAETANGSITQVYVSYTRLQDVTGYNSPTPVRKGIKELTSSQIIMIEKIHGKSNYTIKG
mgnify:CR=1 FL=1